MMSLPRLVGMVHPGPLPGAPGYGGDINQVVAAALADATALEQAGFDAVMIENFGDAPFWRDDVEKVTVAAMSVAVREVVSALAIPVGVNMLRNDAIAALAVAAVAGASMIRVNVLTGTMFTDQGPIVGRAARVARARKDLCPDVVVLADVFVKHATPPPGLTLGQATEDTLERGGADAVVVTGSSTGRKPTLSMLRTVATAAAGAPVYIGSGATAANLPRLLSVIDGAIVGTSIKRRGITVNTVDPRRARAVVRAVAGPGRKR